MVRTPEQYFQDQDFDAPELSAGQQLTSAEHAFLQKYVGVDSAKALGIEFEDMIDAQYQHAPIEPPLEEELKNFRHLQMIFFQTDGHVYTIPIEAVQEVIKYAQPMHLPMTPYFIAGVVNLRGRVTPLIYLDKLLNGFDSEAKPSYEEKFIIICQRRGMQFGMIIDKVQNMYVVSQQDISWNVEFELGASVKCICGILEFNDKIFGIISIDKIVNHVLQSRGTL